MPHRSASVASCSVRPFLIACSAIFCCAPQSNTPLPPRALLSSWNTATTRLATTDGASGSGSGGGCAGACSSNRSPAPPSHDTVGIVSNSSLGTILCTCSKHCSVFVPMIVPILVPNFVPEASRLLASLLDFFVPILVPILVPFFVPSLFQSLFQTASAVFWLRSSISRTVMRRPSRAVAPKRSILTYRPVLSSSPSQRSMLPTLVSQRKAISRTVRRTTPVLKSATRDSSTQADSRHPLNRPRSTSSRKNLGQ